MWGNVSFDFLSKLYGDKRFIVDCKDIFLRYRKLIEVKFTFPVEQMDWPGTCQRSEGLDARSTALRSVRKAVEGWGNFVLI